MSIKNIFKRKEAEVEQPKDYVIVDENGEPVREKTLGQKASIIVGKLITRTLVGASAVVIAGAVVMTASGPFMYDNLSGQDVDSIYSESSADFASGKMSHGDISEHLGPESIEMNNRYQNGNVIMINQSDKNIDFILANIDNRFIPMVGSDYDFTENPIEWFKETAIRTNIDLRGDIKRNWAHYKMENNTKGPHVYSRGLNVDNSQLKVGWVKPVVDMEDFDVKGRYKSPLFFSNEDMDVFVRHHEESHGQDMHEFHHYEKDANGNLANVNSSHQTEVISDLYASLQSAAITGNLNQIKHLITPFRAMNYKDEKHQSIPYINKMMEEGIDFESLSNMTDSEIWIEANKFYKANHMNAEHIKKEMDKLVISGKLFDKELTDEDQRDAGKLEGLTGKSLNESLIDYGKYISQTYADHIEYKGAGLIPDAKIGLLKMVERTSELSGDNELKAKASLMIHKLESDEEVSFDEILKESGITTTASNQQMISDYEKIEQVEIDRKNRVEEIGKKIQDGTFKMEGFEVTKKPAHLTESESKFIGKWGGLGNRTISHDHNECDH